jgi:antitoxin component of MazEF toxin-antitoxin module
MQIIKLLREGKSIIVTLPVSIVDALHLHENDEFAIEMVGDRIILTRADQNFQDAWAAYEAIEPRYRNANRELDE